jgi:hypothetical protein
MVAEALKKDGLHDASENLLRSHEGIFLGTELYFEWRSQIRHILGLKISAGTRKEAERVLAMLDEGLS